MNKRIMWIDDEIDLLRSHIIFLEEKGYRVVPVSSGEDGVRILEDRRFDLLLLDENMPGMSGLETLRRVKEVDINLPVIMITKNEAEDLLNQAIGMKIDDYLLKPLNPLQILSAVKRHLESRKIQEGALSRDYLRVFNRISEAVEQKPGWREWIGIHSELSQWDAEFDRFGDTGLDQTHEDLRKKSNAEFGRYIRDNYSHWIGSSDRPSLSPDVFKNYVVPHLQKGRKVYFIIIDCMRYDQWLTIEDLIAPDYLIAHDFFYSIVPTATPYSRNAIFAGMYPRTISDNFPGYWLEKSNDELSKNRYEEELMNRQLERFDCGGLSSKYVKIYDINEARVISKQASSYQQIDLVAMVFNFLDILAHGRSQSDILQEIAPTESAFRSLMRSWFAHSALYEILKIISRHDSVVVITTDHGSILGKKASLIKGNRETSTNLRYKYGENLNADPKQTIKVDKPEEFGLPSESPSKNYVLATENYYFVYPTNFHDYERKYRGTFQHGGVSLEEMIIPCITLTSRK